MSHIYNPMKTKYEVETLLYAIPIIVVVLGALVGIGLWAALGSGENVPDTSQPNVVGADVEVGSLPPLGNPDAPVQIVMFGDYQCQFCEQFVRETEQQLRAQYIQPGDVVLWWRDFAVLGDGSVRAARAARCANEQGSFWRYHDQLYLNHEGPMTSDALAEHVRLLGLDQERFDACLDSERYSAEVSADQQYGRGLGVQGVPTLFINGRKVVGAQNYEVFKRIIDEALRTAE